jgi:bifunctional DNA-binding transcriptional regulator/antitoxin component of YhaV-PrlF toxin-antitoxin module
MAKVTSKLQVTLPKGLAAQYGIEPGSDIEWQAAGDVIRVLPAAARRASLSKKERLALFDAATQRQKGRQRATSSRATQQLKGKKALARGWKREDLYQRGSTR